MMHFATELPDGVKLSEHHTKGVPFYIGVQSFGLTYWIPAKPKIRMLLELDVRGRDAKRDRRFRWDRYRKADALRDIVSALEIQVRDVVLAGIEQKVTDALLDRMREVMSPTVRGMIDEQAQKALPAPEEKR